MTDRELLEAAAKAAGIDLQHKTMFGGDSEPGYYDAHAQWQWWNPLTDDGEALRLAVNLRICFGPNFDEDMAVAFGREGRNICEPYGADPYAATRRAIVRAAAEIGKSIP